MLDHFCLHGPVTARIARILAIASVVLTASTADLRAQQAKTPPKPTAAQQQILNKLKASHMTREQVRQKLRQAGYDPNLADQYMDAMDRTDSTATGNLIVGSKYARPLPPVSGGLVAALKRIGILSPDEDITVTMDQRARPDTINIPPKRREKPKEPQVFGRDIFAASTQFEPVKEGPVDAGYRLGPGDQLTLLVTGDVELAYELEVTREGFLVVPDVGQVVVNGLTLDEAKKRLNERLSRVYSGITVGTTQADVSMGRLRSKLIYVIGDVEVPGAHELTGSATVFSALYRAGGPTLNGSFRNIEVRRGNKTIAEVDLYDYLLRGDKRGDFTLEQGDVVFVPVVGPQVTVAGSVRRPAIFELKSNERLGDVMRFAGGTVADASTDRIQIDRILPVTERRPGHERVLVDVKMAEIATGQPVEMKDGDHITISRISETRRNRVEVSGDVERPGVYEYSPGMTALQLIQNAGGLLPSAYTPASHVVRLDLADSSTSIVRVVLDDQASPDYAGNVVLDDLDELMVFGRTKLAIPKKVEIFGYVKSEGTYVFSEGMTVQDLVLLAGGFLDGARETSVEVARRNGTGIGRDTLADLFTVPLDMELSGNSKGSGTPPFKLKDGDQVFVRRLPGYQPLAVVDLLGEVVYPGPYTVKGRQERLTDVITRAGGLTNEAFPQGLRLFRDGKPLAVNFPKALKKPHGADDITLEPGDRLEIPRLDPTVLVTGAVAYESRVRYEPSLSLSDYIARAGGVVDVGNRNKASVRYANGELRTVSRHVGVHNDPKIQPGATITIPLRSDADKFDWDKVVGRTLTALSSLATLLLTVKALQ